jgi:hypothetical protein
MSKTRGQIEAEYEKVRQAALTEYEAKLEGAEATIARQAALLDEAREELEAQALDCRESFAQKSCQDCNPSESCGIANLLSRLSERGGA